MNEYTADELRALDARIACEVMGWIWLTPGHVRLLCSPDTPYGGEANCQLADESMPLGLWGSWYALVPRYTTDPAAFTALLDALTAIFGVQANMSGIRLGKLTFYATVEGAGRGPVKRRGHAHSQPSIMIALVLAALAACEKEAGS